ncbi:MAG: cobalt-precorrin-6A reductase [Rhodobacteraceae bacterium]|nr:cobalt-precorrin-6A reductase [Paracoccaceae bacterium]
MTRILLLGGTTEASLLARELATKGFNAIFSYAGRTNAPISQPLPTRIGGFGGSEGLKHYLQIEAITHVIDATHPFASRISSNVVTACKETQTSLIAFERPPWSATTTDRWIHVPNLEAAVNALSNEPARVFLAIGKQALQAFAIKPQHHYLLRLIDEPEAPIPLPDYTVIIAKGPFTKDADITLLRDHAITHIVAKNAGGTGTRAKLDAARTLGLPVIMIDRPTTPFRPVARTVTDIMVWLENHPARLGV